MITNQISSANTFNDWLTATQAIITYLNNTEHVPNTALFTANTALNLSQIARDTSNTALVTSSNNILDIQNINDRANTIRIDLNTLGLFVNSISELANTSSNNISEIYDGEVIKVPVGDSTNRPPTPPEGSFRYNSTTKQFEGFNGSWVGVGGVPVGSVIPFMGGYFTNSLNRGFISVLGNNASEINSLLNSSGFYVCDGSACNVTISPIFNGSGRFLPNISDDRFIMGSTSIGETGGDNEYVHNHNMEHTHGITHTHTMSHTHNMNHTHTHSHVHYMRHYHGTSNHTLTASQIPSHAHTHHNEVWANVPGSAYRTTRTTGNWCNTISHGRRGHIDTYATGSSGAHNHGNTGWGSNGDNTNGPNNATSSGPSVSNTGDTNTSSTGNPNNTNTSSISTSSTSNSTNKENRPKFLSCIYIMRIF